MAFCKQCGSDLNGANFCPNCGAAADGAPNYTGAPVGADVRQRSMADMQHMVSYFGAKKETYDAYEKVSAEVEERSLRSFGGWIGAAIISVLIGLFSEAVFFYIMPVGFIAVFILLKKQNKDKLSIATARQAELHNELEAYFEAYGYCPVGFEYTKPSTLEALYDLIRKGRAATPGDAINVYLEDEHITELIRLQQEATDAAKETAKNTKQAAKSARKAARYASASFWFK